MIVADVNVVVAAFREDHPHHEVARAWLERTLTGSQSLIVPDLVWVGFTRIVTNGHIFDPPAPLSAAFEFVDAVCSAPRYVAVAGLSDGIARFQRAAEESEASGNLVPDAYIAAIAFSHAASVASFDRDFRRFDGLRIVVPSL